MANGLCGQKTRQENKKVYSNSIFANVNGLLNGAANIYREN